MSQAQCEYCGQEDRYGHNAFCVMNTVYELRAEIERLRVGIADIKKATIEGRVCDDVAWFDTITTLHDFCDLLLNNGKLGDQQFGENK